jgi:hypothetical protein
VTVTEARPILDLELPELQAEILHLLWAHEESKKPPPRRSTVEGYVLLDVERGKHPDLPRAALRGGLRRRVALALLALQQLGLVSFAPQGILLTDEGGAWLDRQVERDGSGRHANAEAILSAAHDFVRS